MLKTALLISNRQELLEFLNSIAEENFIDDITRPDTKFEDSSDIEHHLLRQSLARRTIRKSYRITFFYCK